MNAFKQLYTFIKRLLNSSIRNRIILYFSALIIFFMVFLGAFSYDKSSEILVNEVINYTNKVVDQTVMNVDSYFEDIKYTALFISTDSSVLNALIYSDSTDWKEKLDGQSRENNLISGIIRVKPSIFDILVIGKNGYKDNANASEYIDSKYDFFKQPWLKEVFDKNKGSVNFISLHPQDYYTDSVNTKLKKGSMTVSVMIIPINSQYSIYNNSGFVMCDFKLEKLNNIFQSLKLENGGNIFLVDNKGTIVFHSENSIVGKRISENDYNIAFKNDKGSLIKKEGGSNNLFIYSTIKTSGWKVIASIPMDSLYAKTTKIKEVMYRALIVCIILIIIISSFISTGITRPLNNLVKYMKHAEEGNFNIKISKTGYGEVADLEWKFKEMIRKINILIKDVYQSRLKQKEAEFDALQSQINPHFLYNTLQIIKAEAVLNDDKKVSYLITCLGNLLRYATYDKKEMVRIKDEIEYIKDFFYIYSNRYEGRIKFNLSIGENVLKYRTPKLILQPIVENALIHGLGDKEENGEVALSINCIEGNEILFEINDNGCGIQEDKLKKLMYSLNDDHDGRSIGLKNVHERIKLKFGSRYGVNISSEYGLYTSVKILIPAVVEPERGNSIA